MAELPDLEVFSRILTRKYAGKVLEEIEVMVNKKLNVSSAQLKDRLEGDKLSAVRRSGKTLQFYFENGAVLGLHLMLRGELVDLSGETVKYPIAKFHFKAGDGFAVVDMQKQATLTLDPEENNVPDALWIDLPGFKKLVEGKKTIIKTLLMDQKKIRGIGNSYGDEILYHAGISPFSFAGKIPEPQVKKLYGSIKTVLEKAIKNISKENCDELRGELRDFMEVHGAAISQTAKGEKVFSEKIGGRTSYYTRSQELFD
jgi:formamidopyrimidine-DNA glycosylase